MPRKKQTSGTLFTDSELTLPAAPPSPDGQSRKGHFVKKIQNVHLQAYKTPEHTNCYTKEVGGISYEGSKKAEKTDDPQKVTCPHCRSTFVGTSGHNALIAAQKEKAS